MQQLARRLSSSLLELQPLNARLLTIGGKHINGMPRLRVVSALTETKFACGGTKIKYPRASKTDERWLWGLKDTETGIITAKSEQQVVDNKDPKKFGVRKLLSRTVTWIGHPNFVVEYYRSPMEMKDGPVNWERNRYGWWYNPETKRNEWTDINGPWPGEGRYDFLLAVKVDDGTPWGKFRELGEDVLDEVRFAIQKHAAFKKVNTDEELIQQMIDTQEAREDKAAAEIGDAVEQEIGPEWRRMLKDNPRVFQSGGDPAKMNKLTNHGRAR